MVATGLISIVGASVMYVGVLYFKYMYHPCMTHARKHGLDMMGNFDLCKEGEAKSRYYGPRLGLLVKR